MKTSTTKINRHLVKGDFIFVKGAFCEISGTSICDGKMIVSHTDGISTLPVFARSEVLA